jgi:hypothetical protein
MSVASKGQDALVRLLERRPPASARRRWNVGLGARPSTPEQNAPRFQCSKFPRENLSKPLVKRFLARHGTQENLKLTGELNIARSRLADTCVTPRAALSQKSPILGRQMLFQIF